MARWKKPAGVPTGKHIQHLLAIVEALLLKARDEYLPRLRCEEVYTNLISSVNILEVILDHMPPASALNASQYWERYEKVKALHEAVSEKYEKACEPGGY